MCRAGCNTTESLGHILQRCHRTDSTRIRRHDSIVDYVARRLRAIGWDVLVEPTMRTSEGRRFPDLVATRGEQAVILDAQVVGTRISLAEAHKNKVAKYSVPEILDHVRGARKTAPLVSSVTLSYRGVWAKESADVLSDMGLGRQDMKLITIRSLKGGVACFRRHQRMTSVLSRVMTRCDD